MSLWDEGDCNGPIVPFVERRGCLFCICVFPCKRFFVVCFSGCVTNLFLPRTLRPWCQVPTRYCSDPCDPKLVECLNIGLL